MKKNIVFFAHNFGGLGHFNRIFVVMQKFLKNFGNEYNIIFLQSGEKQDFLFEAEGIKIVTLPHYQFENFRIANNDYNKKIFILRKNIFEKIFSMKNIEKFIVEHFPFGRYGMNVDFLNAISIFKKYNPNGVLMSSVRDIIDIDNLVYENIDLFDRIMIHGDENIINYHNIFPEYIRHKVFYTGYVVNDGCFDEGIQKRDNCVVISLGGGQDGFEYVMNFLNIYKQLENPLKIYLSLGKQYNSENLQTILQNYCGEIEIKDYFSNFVELKKEAALVVSMGGYNSMIESINLKSPVIIYPRKTDREQLLRLKIFQKKFNNFFDGNNLNIEKLKQILSFDNKNNYQINIDGGYQSANFIYNFGKYKFLKIRLTNRCNATCDMCGVIKRKIDDNDFLQIKQSIEDFYKIGGQIVNFTGGEPTIYKGFWDLVYFAKKLKFIVSVSTNGSTLGKVFFEKLNHDNIRNIDYIDISVDGLYEIHDKIRQVPNLFHKINENILPILQAGIFLHINVTIRNDNIFQMKDVFDFFYKKGVQSISFGMVASDPLNDTSNLIPNYEQLKKFYLNDIREIEAGNHGMKIRFSPEYSKEMSFSDFCLHIANKNAFPKIRGKQCGFIVSKKEIRINEGGLVTPCCILDDYDEKIGNIRKNRLINIICSEIYENFLHRKFPNISTACLQCKLEIQ